MSGSQNVRKIVRMSGKLSECQENCQNVRNSVRMSEKLSECQENCQEFCQNIYYINYIINSK